MKNPVTKHRIYLRMQAVVAKFCTEEPPLELMMHDKLDNYDKFADWCHAHLTKCFSYSTALAIFDAAEDIATSQIQNGVEALVEDEKESNQPK